MLAFEIVDAVRTFSAREGLCIIPLIGPPTIELGLMLPLLALSIVDMFSRLDETKERSRLADAAARSLSGRFVVQDTQKDTRLLA